MKIENQYKFVKNENTFTISKCQTYRRGRLVRQGAPFVERLNDVASW